MANENGNGNGWTSVKVFTIILAINAVLLPLAVSLVVGITRDYGDKFDASGKLLGDHERRIVILEERVLSRQEKQELLSLLAASRRTGR